MADQNNNASQASEKSAPKQRAKTASYFDWINGNPDRGFLGFNARIASATPDQLPALQAEGFILVNMLKRDNVYAGVSVENGKPVILTHDYLRPMVESENKPEFDFATMSAVSATPAAPVAPAATPAATVKKSK